jgi:membrane glycosyltransferase
VGRVRAGLRAVYRSLAATGPLDGFTFFLLSDSTDPAVARAEEDAVRALRAELGAGAPLVYRRRPDNRQRKSGNIADFCARWGPGYDYMVVLDADSLLEGGTVREMVRRMDRGPRLGILQVPARPVGRGSLFGRIQQFAAHVYGPLATAGLDLWLGGAAPYWGHNAIIRVAPFARHCRLPRLAGPEPLGGDILSHDFVEAALMRRAGWEVRLAADLGGSYEELPPSLLAHAARDRRWCQGNLQHLRLVGAPGLRPGSRLTLAVGALSYLCAPAWVLFVVVVSLGVAPSSGRPGLEPLAGREGPAAEALALVGLMLVLFLVPKALAVLRLALLPGALAARGGAGAVLASVAAESLFSVLVTPIVLAFQAQFVVALLARRATGGWSAQAREDRVTTLDEAAAAHAGHTLSAGLVGAAAYALDAALVPWLLPTLAGLGLSIPLSLLTSRVDWGQRARRWGLFLIPEESAPPAILRAVAAARASAPVDGGRRATPEVPEVAVAA